jgi:hypothetical protein
MRFYKKPLLKILQGLAFFVIFSTNVFTQQLKGTVYNEKNEPLSFVNISIDGTGIGTSSNLSGVYGLPLKNGTYTVTYRYVGFATIKKEVVINGKDVILDIIMQQQAIEIKPFYMTKGGEDPAYGIIRKAQKQRKYYLEQVKNYQYDSYIKGSAFLRNAPEKVMGREVFLDGLDSTRSGMIYLSESVSKIYIKGRDEKEIMVSSKVAGRSQGFSWNSALEFQLNFYENLVPTPVTDRDVVSPIAIDAMTYYKYKLLGEYLDNDGRTIYKIEVNPKLTGSPLVNGIIEIQDSTWRIHSIDIFVTKDNGMNLLDTLNMKVIFVPITNDIWLKGTQQFDFRFTFNLFKIKGDGHFLGSFNNYVIDPVYEKNFFNNEVVKINEESNKKSDAYWDSIRPVPLTKTESRDYEFKDSLEDVRESKTYLDSLDRKRNKFKATDLITGYTWRNSYHRLEFNVSSPLMGFHFNTVEGIVLRENFYFEKYFKEIKATTSANLGVRYGFSNGRFHIKGGIRHRFNSTNRWFIGIDGGHFISQFNENGMPELHNTLYTIFLEINHWRIYEKDYIKLSTGGEMFNGFWLNFTGEIAHRRILNNANPLTQFYINNTNRNFGANDDFKNPTAVLPGNFSRIISGRIQLSYTPGQKYMMRPRYKLNYPSKWPTVGIIAKIAILQNDSTVGSSNYVFGETFIEQDIDMGIIGNSEYYASAGYYFIKPNTFFDYQHFNTTQTAFSPSDELRSFWALPYYQASTNDWFVQVHYQHHFKGLLLGKIPGIKKAKIYEVAGFHFLYNPLIKDYYEFTIGFENILRVFRVDFVGGFIRGEAPIWGGRIKIRI